MRNPMTLLLLTSTACGTNQAPTVDPEPPGQLVQSALPRNLAPQISEQDAATWRRDTTTFALDVYRAAAAGAGEENLCFSPHSIALALAMTYAGAAGNTKTEMAEALELTLPDATLHAAFNAADLALAGESDFELNMVNQTFGQEGYAIESAFLDVLAQNYGAGLRLLDFMREPEPARLAINAWVEDITKNLIRNLIPQGAITTYTRLVLANAIYFKAEWQSTFSEEGTHRGSFTGVDGTVHTVERMYDIIPARYADFDGYTAVELPYVGDSMSMLVLVPHAGSFTSFEAGLVPDLLDSATAALAPKAVALTLPKFEHTVTLPIKRILSELGMHDAFDPMVADLSGINPLDVLYISDVLHKAFIRVDEEGTEAAAATAVVVGTTSAPTYDVELVVDRPFVYAIRHAATGAILFAGRVVAP